MAAKGKRSPRKAKQPVAAEDGERPKIDEVLERLEGVVEELESGDLPLEQALTHFEEGVKLARQGGLLLDAIEERVEVLLANRGETVPFDPENENDDGEL